MIIVKELLSELKRRYELFLWNDWERKPCTGFMKAMDYKTGLFQDIWYGWFWNAYNIVYNGDIIEHPGPSFKGGMGGISSFDGFNKIPVDYKVHNMNDGDALILNDRAATLNALLEYEKILYIVAVGVIEKSDRDYSISAKWVIPFKEMCGKKSKLGKRSNVNRFRLLRIDFILIDKDNFSIIDESFQTGFKNAGDDSAPRTPKCLLQKKKYKKLVVETVSIV